MEKKLKKHTISFIIAVLNGEKYVGQCLDHIIKEMDDNDEIIVVDNGSTDGTLNIIKSFIKVKCLIFPKITIAALRNRGANIAGGDILAFIDSDCLVCEGWRNAVEEMFKDRNIHATGSRCHIPDNAKWIEKAWYSQKFKNAKNVTYINSGNLGVRKDVFIALSGFNENLITDEDYDFGVRLNKFGYAIVETPEIRVIHLGNPKTLTSFFKKELWHSIYMLSLFKRGYIDKPTVITIIFMIAILVSIVVSFSEYSSLFKLIFISSLLFSVPVFTSIYRIVIFKNMRYFFHLVILYFLFYFARSIRLIKLLKPRWSK